MVLAWNPLILPKSETWHLQNASRSGGVSFSGVEQVIVAPSSLWKASLSFDLIVEADAIEVEGFIAALYGRATPFLIGPFDDRGKPEQPNAHQEDRFRSNFSVAAPADLNATRMRLNRIRGGDLRPGHLFTVGERLHRVTTASKIDADVFDITFAPWLREAVPQGAVADFDRRVCTMRLATDDSGMLERSVSPVSVLALELIEAFR